MKNILTIDVEDYFQVENFKDTVKFSDWPGYESRVGKNTGRILSVLDDFNTKATFFVLGWVAEKHPEIIKRIYDGGHEIASHGYAHELVYSQTPEEFRLDLRKSKVILEKITGRPVNGYRAPCYSITEKSLWALDVLKEEGFTYDSSLFPIRHDHGGLPAADRYTGTVNGLKEFPLSTVRVLGQNVPFSGGGYFRLLPYGFIKWGAKKINEEGYPAVMYLHPWEFDPDQPRIKTSMTKAFRHYVNMAKTEEKLKRLLRDFEFTSIREIDNEKKDR